MAENNIGKNGRNISLKYKLILAGLASILIPLLILGLIIYLQLYNSLFKLEKEKATHLTQDMSASINEKLMDEIKLVSSIAADPDIINAAKTGVFHTAQLEIESIYKRIGTEYFTIFLTDKNGINRADAFFKEQIGLNLSEREYFVQAKAGKTGVAGPLMPKGTATPDTPIIIVYAPIRHENEFCGIVVLPFNIDFLADILAQHHIGKTGFAYLINDEGLVLAHPRREFILNLLLFDQPGTEELKQLVSKKENGIATSSFEGIKRIAAVSRIELTGWTAVFAQNRDEVLAPAHKIIFSMFIYGIVFVAVAIIIIVLFAKRISTPIQKMLEVQKEITRHSTETIFQVGLDRKIIYANPAFERTTGIKAEEIMGTEPCLDNPNNLSPEIIWDRLESGNPWSGRVIHKTNGPGFVTLDVMLLPLRDEHGSVQSYLHIGRDITSELMYERRLLQGQKLEAIGTMAGGIAHDFNNILSAIFGFAELSLMRNKCDPDTEKYIKQIIAASERARDLVDQILTFSRNTDIELRPLLPKVVLKEVIKLLRASIPVRIDIQSNMDCDSAIIAEPTQLHQIVMNLFMNAAHAIGENAGTITLDLEDFLVDEEFTKTHPNINVGKHIRIRISDTGGGIEPEIVERIFEPFFTTKSQGQGTGLGLSVVHGIVKKLSGIITVYTELGKGTVFNIIIPCTEAEGSMLDQQELSLRKGSERIVIIDDEQPIAATLQAILTDQGYKITAFTNSLDALKAIEKSPNDVDIIISDYSMPQMSGLELAEKLNKSGINIPIILMSGFFGEHIEACAQHAGIRELIAKPINSFQITDSIHRIMDK
jgi:PAS domain S-box-containing protein